VDIPYQSMKPQLSVVVPLHDEADNVLPLAERIMEAVGVLPGGMELLLVDDASIDATWSRILTAREKNPLISAIRHTANQGQSAALWTGFKCARGSVIATLDGDLQNDPADLPMMLRELNSCDMVCGVRTKRADTLMRRISARVARWARRTALGVDFADSGCNLRVFKASVLEAMPAFNGVHRFMPILAHGAGAVVKEVPVAHHPRAAGVSKYGLWNRLGRGICDLVMVALFLRRQLKLLETRATYTVAQAERANPAVAGVSDPEAVRRA
jgi:dolichol-phosphate mannosyltransferase